MCFDCSLATLVLKIETKGTATILGMLLIDRPGRRLAIFPPARALFSPLMACAVPRVDRGGYKLHLDCPVDAQFVQKLRSIQRQLESALDKAPADALSSRLGSLVSSVRLDVFPA